MCQDLKSLDSRQAWLIAGELAKMPSAAACVAALHLHLHARLHSRTGARGCDAPAAATPPFWASASGRGDTCPACTPNGTGQPWSVAGCSCSLLAARERVAAAGTCALRRFSGDRRGYSDSEAGKGDDG
jgi:hypothetical protein